MTADNESAQNPGTAAPPSKAVAAVAKFATEHGGSARAVVEYVGRAGARVVLVGADGALGDVLVPDVRAGEAVVAAVDDVELSEWGGETTEALKIGPALRRRMGERVS